MQNNKKNSDISSFLMAHEEKKKHLTFNYTQKKRGRNTFHALNIQKNDRINSCGKQAGIHKI